MTTTKKVSVPSHFKPIENSFYPSDMSVNFEQWFHNNYIAEDNPSDRIYLDIMWTAYYKNNNYAKSIEAINKLQSYLNGLDRTKKYFTIIQWDSGIENYISDLDLMVFSMSGKPMDYPLPLLCSPHGKSKMINKRYLYSFEGRVTHEIRKDYILRRDYSSKKDVFINTNGSTLKNYCDNIAQSYFVLCFRGFGPNSFRVAESIEQGAIPVMISDDYVDAHLVPFNSYGIRIPESSIDCIDEILRSVSKIEIEEKLSNLGEIYSNFYTFQSNKELILDYLTNYL